MFLDDFFYGGRVDKVHVKGRCGDISFVEEL